MNALRGVLSREDSAVESKSGFTVIEVMLVLAITGLMLVGILGGTYSSIATQRYNDSVRSFSEFLHGIYSEVISPQSLGDGNSDNFAIYGKVAVFGLNADDKSQDAEDTVYTATLIGNPHPPRDESGFISELQAVGAKLYCGSASSSSTVDEYTPLWQAKIARPAATNPGQSDNVPMRGTLMIVRSPATGVVHTAFSDTFIPNLKDDCRPGGSNITVVSSDPSIGENGFKSEDEVDFCIVSDNSRIVRDLRLAADGHNSSAINLIPADGDVKCNQK